MLFNKDMKTCSKCAEARSDSYYGKKNRETVCIICRFRESVAKAESALDPTQNIVNDLCKNPPPVLKKISSKQLIAQAYVRMYMSQNNLARPIYCQNCKVENNDLHAHHYNGYDNFLDVIFLCRSCHHKAHGHNGKESLND